MPQAIDDEKFKTQETLDMSKPQGTAQGLPVKHIAHQEFPKCVYKHPNAPFFVEEHRNVHHEVVHREVKSAEHRVHVCASKAEHEEKLAAGWKNEPYIQLAPPDPMDALYGEMIAEDIARKSGKAETAPAFDLVAAQKFMQSRGYTCAEPKDAAAFVADMGVRERRGFLRELADFVANEAAKTASDKAAAEGAGQ